jgi:hypothetical protein
MSRTVSQRLRSLAARALSSRPEPLRPRTVRGRTWGPEVLERRALLSHFRSGTIDWSPSGNTVTFHLSQSWREGFAWSSGTPTVGGVPVNTGSTFNFGDGTSAIISLTVDSVNLAEDWFAGHTTLTHTYTSAGSFSAFMQNSARVQSSPSPLVNVRNNSAGSFQTLTLVTIGAAPGNPYPGNRSPVSSLSPIVQVADNQIATFQVPAADPDGTTDTLTYRLSTATEASGNASGFVQPTGLTISSTGLVTWDIRNSALATIPGDLWTAQFMVEDHSGGAAGPVKSKVPVDFILKIGQPVAVNAPPTVNASPAGPFQPVAGNTLTFNVTAVDTDGTITALQATNAPGGMTFSAFGSPASTKTVTATWTPTQAQAGQTIVMTFQATDNGGATATTSVTLSPAANQAPVANNDTFSVNEDTTLNVAAPGVLANDTDAENNSFTASLVSTTTHGLLALNSNGSFTYYAQRQFPRHRQLHLPGRGRHGRGQRGHGDDQRQPGERPALCG